MAKIRQATKNDLLLVGLKKEHKEIIKKMIEIQDIFDNPPSDKKFKRNEIKYLLDYISILNNVQFSDYSDEYMQKAIKSLYDKIFKSRTI